MKNSIFLPWLLTGLAVATSVGYAIVLALGPPNMTVPVLDFSAKIIGPVGAALIAWAGVSHTVMNTRVQDTAKEWHHDLRWASELCASEKPLDVAIGIAVLGELNDHSLLAPDQVKMVRTISETITGEFLHGIDTALKGVGDDGATR